VDHWSRCRWIIVRTSAWKEMSMRDETLVKITAIVSLTVICAVAVLHGIDSVLIGTVSAIIGGIAGYEFRKTVDMIKSKGRK